MQMLLFDIIGRTPTLDIKTTVYRGGLKLTRGLLEIIVKTSIHLQKLRTYRIMYEKWHFYHCNGFDFMSDSSGVTRDLESRTSTEPPNMYS